MKHLTEEEIIEYYYVIEHYYSEDFSKTETEIHLQRCKQCAQAYEEFSALLGSVRATGVPLRGSEYGAQVWESIQRSLQPYGPKRKSSFFHWPQFAYAAACLLLLGGAFWAGRFWEQAHSKPVVVRSEEQTKERVVLFVLDNHLDRSERLLVQLNHAVGEGNSVDFPLQAEAQQLLSDNQLYRQNSARANDPLLNAALDHLERVLLEVANSGNELTGRDIANIQKEMNTQGLLFQIRVLRARVSGQETAQAIGKGANI
jgi:hypothetical protein